MPKKTFLNLPVEKQERIRQAVYEEYTSKKFEDVTTRSLTKRANIPMGSLYQYFENKNDIYVYFIYELVNKNKKYYLDIIEDLTYQNIFEIILNFGKNDLNNFLTEKESEFYKTYQYIPETLLKEMIFDHYDQFFNTFKEMMFENIDKTSFANNLDNSRYIDFITFILFTVQFNVELYAKRNNINFDESIDLNKFLYKEILFKSIL